MQNGCTILDLALEYDIIAYGTSYAALARQFSLPLITADERLARKLEETDIEVVTLRAMRK